MPSKIDVTDRLIKCINYDCQKVIGFTVFQGHDDRVRGYLSKDLVRTTWDYTLTYCPECYMKLKHVKLPVTDVIYTAANENIKLLDKDTQEDLR